MTSNPDNIPSALTLTEWKNQHTPEDSRLPFVYLLFCEDNIVEGTDNHLYGNLFFHKKIENHLRNYPSIFLGATHTHNIKAIDLTGHEPDNLPHQTLRQALMISTEQEAAIIKTAASVTSWNRRYQFCFSCGSKLVMASDERAKICPSCDTRSYTHVSPCVIMAIRRENKILLARHSGMPAKIYSTLAGFIEPGESAEDAVSREVMEETNITVKNIEYLGSQAWPFPSQLMLGFLCEYESGDLEINTRELEHGQWFDIRQLPELPSKISIANLLIKTTIERIKESLY